MALQSHQLSCPAGALLGRGRRSSAPLRQGAEIFSRVGGKSPEGRPLRVHVPVFKCVCSQQPKRQQHTGVQEGGKHLN
jgi:hypothetical protein